MITEAGRIGLCSNEPRVDKVRAGSDKTEDVTEFVYLSAKVSKDGWRNRGH